MSILFSNFAPCKVNIIVLLKKSGNMKQLENGMLKYRDYQKTMESHESINLTVGNSLFKFHGIEETRSVVEEVIYLDYEKNNGDQYTVTLVSTMTNVEGYFLYSTLHKKAQKTKV